MKEEGNFVLKLFSRSIGGSQRGSCVECILDIAAGLKVMWSRDTSNFSTLPWHCFLLVLPVPIFVVGWLHNYQASSGENNGTGEQLRCLGLRWRAVARGGECELQRYVVLI